MKHYLLFFSVCVVQPIVLSYYLAVSPFVCITTVLVNLGKWYNQTFYIAIIEGSPHSISRNISEIILCLFKSFILFALSELIRFFTNSTFKLANICFPFGSQIAITGLVWFSLNLFLYLEMLILNIFALQKQQVLTNSFGNCFQSKDIWYQISPSPFPLMEVQDLNPQGM